jgi:hypothetical protein
MSLGDSLGLEDISFDGSKLGSREREGEIDSSSVGEDDEEGLPEGTWLGSSLGMNDGSPEGSSLGNDDGRNDGTLEGSSLGFSDGSGASGTTTYVICPFHTLEPTPEVGHVVPNTLDFPTPSKILRFPGSFVGIS